MTLEQLTTLQSIVRLGSFRAASQSMHKAQSALSYSIRTLEDELGFKIFNRSQYRPTLTPQGKAFLKKAEGILFGVDELKTTAAFLQRGHEPQIRLVVSALWPLPLLTECLGSFQKEFPHTEVKIRQDVLSADEQLLEGSADLSFGELFNDQYNLKAKDVVSVTMIPVCSSKHPLAKNKGKASVADLNSHAQIILSSSREDSSRQAAIENSQNNLSVSDFLTKKELISAGLGWGYMPEHLVKEEIKKKSFVQTHQKTISVPLKVAFNPRFPLGPCGQFFWSYFNRSTSGSKRAKP